MNVLGIDVGFSKTRASTGMCISGPEAPLPWLANRLPGSRFAKIPKDIEFAVIAIDGPVVPNVAQQEHKRRSETIFASGSFQRRCKPGFTHFGMGAQLRSAATETVDQFKSYAAVKNSLVFPRMIKGFNFIEAFPNAFLGVQLEDSIYSCMPKLKRGQKFDWLYDRWLECKLNLKLQEKLDWDDSQLWRQLSINKNHDERAALICALTAICVVKNQFSAIGDDYCGRIFLPSLTSWAEWSRRAIEMNRSSIIEGVVS